MIMYQKIEDLALLLQNASNNAFYDDIDELEKLSILQEAVADAAKKSQSLLAGMGLPERNDNWVEVYFTAAAEICHRKDTVGLGQHQKRIDESGRGGKHELAEELANKFMTTHKNRQWNGEFFDCLEDFFTKEFA